jgi:hypothetical protein
MAGCLAYWRALGEAGLDPASLSHVLVTAGVLDDQGQSAQPASEFRISVEPA